MEEKTAKSQMKDLSTTACINDQGKAMFASTSEQVGKKKLRILVVGSGFGGSSFAYNFDKKMGMPSNIARFRSEFALASDGASLDDSLGLEFLWVSRLPALNHSIGHPRALVDKKSIKCFYTPLAQFWPPNKPKTSSFYSTKYLHANVLSIESNHAMLQALRDDGKPAGAAQRYDFDYCVLAFGSISPFPANVQAMTVDAAVSGLEDAYEKIKAAKSVLVVGGGPISVEMAGEVKTTYPDKKVTLICGNEALLHKDRLTGYVGEKMQRSVKKALEKLKIELVFNERVSSHSESTFEPSTVKTDNDREYQADVVLWCVGSKLDVNLLQPLIDQNADTVILKEGTGLKSLNVNGNLQLRTFPRIFALGDPIDTNEGKLGFFANRQGKYLADLFYKLVKAHISFIGKAHSEAGNAQFDLSAFIDSAPEYKPFRMKLQLITLGRNVGRTQVTHGIVLGDFVTKWRKGRDMGLATYLKFFNLSSKYESDFDK